MSQQRWQAQSTRGRPTDAAHINASIAPQDPLDIGAYALVGQRLEGEQIDLMEVGLRRCGVVRSV